MIEQVKNYRQKKEMAENAPDVKAIERFRRPAYCAKKNLKEQEQKQQLKQKLKHKTVEQYLAEKYNITQRRDFSGQNSSD